MIVLGTVLLNATTARLFAKITGVFLKKSNGILIIGASAFSQLIGKYLKENNRNVVLIDSNKSNIAKAKELGLDAFVSNIYSADLEDNIELNDIGFLMALTGSSEINKYAIQRFQEHFGEHGAFRIITEEEKKDPTNNPKEGLFSHTDDFSLLSSIAKKHPTFHEVKIEDKEHYNWLIEQTIIQNQSIPVFLKDDKGELTIISSFSREVDPKDKNLSLVYVGVPIKAKQSS